MDSIQISTIFLVAVLLFNSVYAQSLFPPVETTVNFALRQPSSATSTCGMCEVEELGCTLCNSSCPYEQQAPEPMNLLEVGTLASGVAQTNMTSVEGSPIYEFSGNEESYVTFTEDLSFQPSQGLTFTAWVQQDQRNDGYVFAKTTESGITSFYALYLDSQEQSAGFEYRYEGLEEGFRTISLTEVNVADGRFHHIAVSVYGSSFALYLDGRLHGSPQMLTASLEDGLGVFFLGRRQAHSSRFSGLMHSVFYFNSTLSDSNIATLAAVASGPLTQPECQCPPTHSIVLEHECQDLSGTGRIPRINLAAHDVANINDGNSMTWWQSSNMEAPVNVTVGLGGLRAALVVVMQFNSLLPKAMVLYYSTDGNVFYPRQYYAADCSNFSLPDNGPLSTSTDVNCVTSNSLPLENQYVEFRVLDMGNRPGVEDYFTNSDLQVFAQATHIRLELLAWNTDVLADQHFAVNEVMVFGQACVCNGHATMCDGATCICEQNTTGIHCEDCLEEYFKYSPEVCRICQCNNAGTIGGSNLCNTVTGQCPCKPNFASLDCSLCAPGNYGDGRNATCLPCDDECLECTGPGLINCMALSTAAPVVITPSTSLQLETSNILLFPLPSTMIEPLVSLPTADMALSTAEFILQPSTELLLPAHPSMTLMLPIASPVTSSLATRTLLQRSTASVTSELLPSAMQPVTLQPSILFPSVVTRSKSPNLLLPLPSSELSTLSNTVFLLPTSVFVLDESSLSLELFPSIFLPEIQQTLVSIIPQNTLSVTRLVVTSSDITDLTASPEPSETTLPVPLSSPPILFPFTSFLRSPQILSTFPADVTPSPSLQLETSSTLLFPQPGTVLESLVSSPAGDMALSISDFILQPSTRLLLLAHPSTTVMLPIATPMTSSLVTTPTFQATSTILQTSEGLPSTVQPVTLQPSIVTPTDITSSESLNLLLPLPSPVPSSPVPSLLMTLESSAPMKSSPTYVIETTVPMSAAGSPFPTQAPTLVPFLCPSPLLVSFTADSLVNIVLVVTVTEHLELTVDRSPRQCRLEEALVVVFEVGLQVLEGSQGRKKRQLQNNENYAARITEVGPLSSSQSTITFYIINITAAMPLSAVDVVQAFQAADQQEIDTYLVLSTAPVVIAPSTSLQLETLLFPLPSTMVEPLVSLPTADMALSTAEFILQPSSELLLSSHPSVTLMLPIASPVTSSLVTTPTFHTLLQPSTASLTSEGLPSTMQPVTLQPSILISSRSKSPNLLLPLQSSELLTLSDATFSFPTSVFALDESSLLLELFQSTFLPEIHPTVTSIIPQNTLSEMRVIATSSDITDLTVSPEPLSVPQLPATQSSSLFPEVATDIVPESATLMIFSEQVSPVPTPFSSLHPPTPLFVSLTSSMEQSSPPPAQLSSPPILFPFTSVPRSPQILSTFQAGVTPSPSLQLETSSTLLFPLPSTVLESLVSSPARDMALSISDFILQSAHPSVTLMLPSASPMASSLVTTPTIRATSTIIRLSTDFLTSEELPSTIQPVTLLSSVLIPTVLTSSESPNLLLPLPSSELLTLSETLLFPTSLLNESSLPLELFPSILLSESQPTVTFSLPQTTLSDMHVIVTSSDITQLTVSPQPSEVTLSVLQLPATQSSSLFPEVATDIVPESATLMIFSEQVSPVPTPFSSLHPPTPLFVSLTSSMEPSSPPPAQLSSPPILYPFTSVPRSPQILSTFQAGVTPSPSLQLETSSTLLFPLPSTVLESLVSSPARDMALSISDFILQSAHLSVTLMLPSASPMASSLVTTPTIRATSTIIRLSTDFLTSEELPSTIQPVTLLSSVLIPTVLTSSESPNLLLPLPSSELLTLSETLVFPTSLLNESSLPLELFPSILLSESQPTVTFSLPQTTLSDMHVIVTSSDITQLTVSPQPSEVTLSVLQLLATQSFSLFPEVATEIATESAMLPMLSDQVSSISTPLPPLTPLFSSRTSPIEVSPPPAPLSSPLSLFPLTSFLITPQVLSTSPVGIITPSTSRQLETSTTSLFPLPSTMVEPLVSSPTGDMAFSISGSILQPSSELLLSSHPSVTLMLPTVSRMTTSLVTTPTIQATTTFIRPSTALLTSEELPSTVQPTLQPSILIPTAVTSSGSPDVLLPLPSSELLPLSVTSFLLPTSVIDESSLLLELFQSSFRPEILPTVTSINPQTTLHEIRVIVTSSDITKLTVSPQPSEVTLSVSRLLGAQSLSLLPEVTTEILTESAMLPTFSEQVSPILTLLPLPTPLSLSLTSPMETSSLPPAPLSSPLILFPFTSLLVTPQLSSTTRFDTTPSTSQPNPQLEISTTLQFPFLSMIEPQASSFSLPTSVFMSDDISSSLEVFPSTFLPNIQPKVTSTMISQLSLSGPPVTVTSSDVAELRTSISEIALSSSDITSLPLESSSIPTPSLSSPLVTPPLFSITSASEPFSLPLPTPSTHTLTLFLSSPSFEGTASAELTSMTSSDPVLPESSSQVMIPNLTHVILSTLQATSVEVAILSAITQTVSTLALTGIAISSRPLSSSELRSHIQLPTSSVIAQPTISGVQVVSSVMQHTSVPAVLATEITVSSLLMASQSSAPVKSSPTSVIEATVPISAPGSHFPTPSPTPVSFICPPPLEVSSTIDSLVDIVLAFTVAEHLELTEDRSARQCRLEVALAVVYDMGLQLLVEGSQGRKKQQLQKNENHAARIAEVGPLSSGQSTITFYIINITAAMPLPAVDVVQAFQAANQQEIDTYPVIHQPFPNTLVGTESTIIPTVAGVVGSVLLVLLIVTAVICVGLLWRFRKKRTDQYTLQDPGGEAGTLPTDDFVVQPIENQHRPSHVISIGRPSHTGMVQSASETTETPSLQDDQVPAECVAHYDTSQASPLMQPKFREIVLPPPSTAHEGSQYADGRGYSGSVQGQRLYDDVGRLQEERVKQELKARRKATYKRYKHGSGGKGKRKEGLSIQKKLTLEDTDAPFPSATPVFGLPGSSRRTTHPFTRLNRVGPLTPTMVVSPRLSRSQHGSEEPISRLTTTGRLPRGIAHGVHQEMTWMETGNGVQLLRIEPFFTKQQPHRANPLPAWEPHEAVLDHTQTTPESTSHFRWEDGSRLGTGGEAEKPPDASPDTSNCVQDLIQEAFSVSPAPAHTRGGSSGRHQQQTSTAILGKERSALPQQQAFTHGTPAVAWQGPALLSSHAAEPVHTHPQYTPQDLTHEAFSISPSLAHLSGGSSGGHQQQTSTPMPRKEEPFPQQQAFTHVAWRRPASLPRHAADISHTHPQYTPQPVDYAEDMGQLVWTPPSSAQTQSLSPPPLAFKATQTP